MDLSQTPTMESKTKPSLMITSALVSAVLEWMLIFLLFINASFSYLVTKFARYCQLQVPCLLCSRLDHVLGDERAGFYWELICQRHKSKISSLIFCRLHDNLVDIHGTCESCLFSFATIKKSNAEIYRLVIGKLGDEPYYGPSQAASSDEHNTRNCTCCNEQWIPSMYSEKLCNSKTVESESSEVNRPPSFISKCNVEDEVMEGSSQRDQACNKDINPLPHLEYTKVKVASHAGSEGPFSDNGSANMHFCETEMLGHDLSVKHVPPEPKTISVEGCPSLEKSIRPAYLEKPSLSELEGPSDFAHNAEYKEPSGHGLEESNCHPDDCNINLSETSDFVSFPEAIASPSINRPHREEPKDNIVSMTTELEKEVHVESGEVLNTGSGLEETPELQKEVTTTGGKTSTAGNDCILKNEIQIDLKSNKTDTSTQIAESLDLGDAYKLALGARGRQLSGRLLEQQRSMTDSTRASEDLKLLLSQISAARRIDYPLYDMSPRVSANSEDFKAVDASGVVGMQILQRRISLERNESNLSFEGSSVSEIEGESVADRLKRQVEHDKKIMSALYKELEEERSASAIAANQAMAMITRLQEEKAALNMEALQCLRMMEEQAEYDDEALQKANDALAEKEKQIRNFEYELGWYRNQFGDISLSNNADNKPRPESEVEASCEKSNVTTLSISDRDKYEVNIGNVDGAPKMLEGYVDVGGVSSEQLEDEKRFILQTLRKLEEKLIMFSTGLSDNNGGTETNHLPIDRVMPGEASEDLSRNKNSQIEEHVKGISRIQVNREAELDEIRQELTAMNSRLDALEAELNVTEGSINSIEKGSEGFEFIREIAGRVQELHSTYIRRSEDLR